MSDGKQGAVTLREITAESLSSILDLAVAESQENLVAPNAVSISQAHFSEQAWFRAIYVSDTPVGFVMLSLDQELPEYYVWRLMVDASHQGKGYGFQAMQLAIEYVRQLPNAKELYISYVPAEGNAASLYRKCGFVETGEVVEGEIVMKLDLAGAGQ